MGLLGVAVGRLLLRRVGWMEKLVGERVVSIGLIVRAGFPHRLAGDGSGFSFVFRPGLGIFVVEGCPCCNCCCCGAWVFGLTYARFLGPHPDPWLKDGVGGRQVSGEEA